MRRLRASSSSRLRTAAGPQAFGNKDLAVDRRPRPVGDIGHDCASYRPKYGLGLFEVISGTGVPDTTCVPGRPSGWNCLEMERLGHRHGTDPASKDGKGLPDITPGRPSHSPAEVISGTGLPDITRVPGSRNGARRPPALDFAAPSGWSRRARTAAACCISPSSLVVGPPSPPTEPILAILALIVGSAYRVVPPPARGQGRRSASLRGPGGRGRPLSARSGSESPSESGRELRPEWLGHRRQRPWDDFPVDRIGHAEPGGARRHEAQFELFLEVVRELVQGLQDLSLGVGFYRRRHVEQLAAGETCQ